MNLEWLGIVASIVVVISCSFSNIKTLRTLNTVGSALFVVYGVALGSISVVLLNSICIVQNLYKLKKLKSENSKK